MSHDTILHQYNGRIMLQLQYTNRTITLSEPVTIWLCTVFSTADLVSDVLTHSYLSCGGVNYLFGQNRRHIWDVSAWQRGPPCK